MPDYTPAFTPGLELTYRALTDVIGGRIVEVAGPGRLVRHTAGASSKVVGIAAHDAKAGDTVAVLRLATQQPTAASPIAVGDRLSSAADGKAATAAADGPVIALALGSAAAGATVEANFYV